MDKLDTNSDTVSADRRRGSRGRALKSGKLIYGGFNRTIIDCFVVEVSETGARVETGVMVSVPESLVLRLPDGTERSVRRAWASGNQIGLEFLPG